MPPTITDDLVDLSGSPIPGRTPTAAGKHQRSALGVASSLAPGSAAKRDASAAADALATPQSREPRRSSTVRASHSHSTFRNSPRRTSRRVSRASRFGGLDGEDDERKLPTLVPGIRPAYSTPLPVLPMVVLCIAMLSELLSANLSQPFMLKMVESFFLKEGRSHGSELEAAVGLWTGNLVSVFYITQFFTSLLWSSIADRHGRRAVLVASMTGSGIALIMFGTSLSLPEAICVRLIQGIFGGAIGVFRGSIRDLTDDTNATRAYAVLGFSWGLGGVVGPIIGGLFENPHLNHPDTFLGRIPIFEHLPYFLPTLMGGVIMFIGAFLACFLSWDGGVRGGQRIQLEMEKDEPLNASRTEAASPVPQRVAPSSALRINQPTRIFSPAHHPEEATPLGPSTYGQSAYGQSVHGGAGHLGTSARMQHRESLASIGTAYGYGGIRSKHPTLAARRAIEAARRVSTADGRAPHDPSEGGDRNVSLATRLLLANEDNTFNINDLWLSAAVAQDTAVFDDDDEYDEDLDDDERRANDSVIDIDDASSLAPTDEGTPMDSNFSSPSLSTMPRTRTASLRFPMSRARLASGGSELTRFRRTSTSSRRYSNSSTHPHMPSIFSNTGVASTPGIQAFEETPDAPDLFSPTGTVRRIGVPTGLTAISEQNNSPANTSTSSTLTERPQSNWKLLPLLVICQYGLLSCHDSTHGQLFLSFIVTPYTSGGVGISPASYSVFVAIMCVGQLIYQFYLFPRLGPPLGRFSHLQMFRLGSMLFVPGYLLVPLLHSFATPGKDGGFFVMTMMALISAIRYCGGTFAYTSIMILINAMTPPHLIGLANGLAQSTVSCARFFGPAFGGALWSTSINGNPGGYASGFYTVAIFAGVQALGSFFIR